MPAKKRKILVSNDMSAESMLKTVLGRTLRQVQVKPGVKESEVMAAAVDASRSSELIAEFDTELDLVLNERVRSDPELVNNDAETKEQIDDIVYNKDRFSLSKKRLN
jgi:hypothetical protein